MHKTLTLLKTSSIIKTFPHHKHSPELKESTSVNLKDVLKEISQKININEDLNSGNDHEI